MYVIHPIQALDAQLFIIYLSSYMTLIQLNPIWHKCSSVYLRLQKEKKQYFYVLFENIYLHNIFLSLLIRYEKVLFDDSETGRIMCVCACACMHVCGITRCCDGPEKERSRNDASVRLWLRWSLLMWCSSCHESSVSTLAVGWSSMTACLWWSARSCGWPLRECSRSRLALVGLLWLLVLQCRPVFTCSLYEWYC
jgi:hypothetical protein